MYLVVQLLQSGISHNGKRCWFSSQGQVVNDVNSGNGVVDVSLAQTGEGIAECELLKWFVKEVSASAAFAFLYLVVVHVKSSAHIVEASMVV